MLALSIHAISAICVEMLLPHLCGTLILVAAAMVTEIR